MIKAAFTLYYPTPFPEQHALGTLTFFEEKTASDVCMRVQLQKINDQDTAVVQSEEKLYFTSKLSNIKIAVSLPLALAHHTDLFQRIRNVYESSVFLFCERPRQTLYHKVLQLPSTHFGDKFFQIIASMPREEACSFIQANPSESLLKLSTLPSDDIVPTSKLFVSAWLSDLDRPSQPMLKKPTLFLARMGQNPGFYVVGSCVGSGGSKTVKILQPLYETIRSTHQLAIAFFKKNRDEMTLEMAKNEFKIVSFLAKNNVPNILPIEKIFVDCLYGSQERKIPSFIMNLCEEGMLINYVRKTDSTIKRMKLGLQLAETIQGIHRLGVYHLDLKIPNILVTIEDGTPRIKVTDFGNSVFIPKGQKLILPKIISTYPAPEMVLEKKLLVSAKTDLWGLGAILYYLKHQIDILTKYSLSYDIAAADFSKKIDEMSIEVDALYSTGDLLDRCIARLLAVRGEWRPPIEYVIQSLQTWIMAREILGSVVTEVGPS